MKKVPKKSNRGLATFDKSNYFPISFLETKSELQDGGDTVGMVKELGVPKIATHALGLDEDNAVDPNEAEQGEEEPQVASNREGEFEIAAGV